MPSTCSPSAVHVLGDCSSGFTFSRTPSPSTYHMYPEHFQPPPPFLPAYQPEPSPEILPQTQPLRLIQTLPQDHLQSPLPKNGEKDHVLSDSEGSSDKHLVPDAEEDLGSHRLSLVGENTIMSGQSLCQRQLENVWKLQSSKEFEEIQAGLPPGPVRSAGHDTRPCTTSRSASSRCTTSSRTRHLLVL